MSGIEDDYYSGDEDLIMAADDPGFWNQTQMMEETGEANCSGSMWRPLSSVKMCPERMRLQNELKKCTLEKLGKEMRMWCLVDRKNQSSQIVITPIKALIYDQVKQLNSLNIKAVGITSDTLGEDTRLWKRVENGDFSVIYACPEVLLKPGSYFWRHMASNNKCSFIRNLKSIIVDEVHCVWKWGESGFREEYKMIGNLRAHFLKVPFFCATATLTPVGLTYIHKTLRLQKPSILHRRSTRRENIRLAVMRMEKGYSPLSKMIPRDDAVSWAITKGMRFVDDCTEAQRIVSFLRGLLHPELQEDGAKLIKPFSASLSNQFREIAIEDFRQGDTRILVCTDAAGMGVDIPVRDLQ
ncbi:P-loop containing nucleoside triphosphate hydrolase protein [Kalaharituber pfeilii]|nr:P-loop containing nucleoside triphosphate hydrolase protein [Kalaharituber pfeilii]